MKKRFKYSLPISGAAIFFIAISWYFELPLILSAAAFLVGFLAGFDIGVEKVYKAATGAKGLTDDELTEVLERVL